MSKDSHLEPNTDLQDLKLLISRIWVSFESKHEPVKSPILKVSFVKFTQTPTHKTPLAEFRPIEIFGKFKNLDLGLAKNYPEFQNTKWVFQNQILVSPSGKCFSRFFIKGGPSAEYSLIHSTNDLFCFFLSANKSKIITKDKSYVFSTGQEKQNKS